MIIQIGKPPKNRNQAPEGQTNLKQIGVELNMNALVNYLVAQVVRVPPQPFPLRSEALSERVDFNKIEVVRSSLGASVYRLLTHEFPLTSEIFYSKTMDRRWIPRSLPPYVMRSQGYFQAIVSLS